jgi:glycosyltransferase involved in cell wall biosynthesis
MTGSEWFDSRPGGLNRYFLELFHAFSRLDDVRADAYAFATPPAIEGAHTWGAEQSTLRRVLSSRSATPDSEAAVVDRHFALYGPSRRRHRSALQIVHFHGPWAQESRVAGAGRLSFVAKRAVERSRYHEADHVIVLSAAFAEILNEQYGVPRERISVIPPGVDAQRFAPTDSPSVADAEAAPPVVLCVRRLEHRMGIDVLIRSWDAASADYPDAQLRIVGMGSAEASLRELASRAKRPESITFTGRLTDAELVAEYAGAAFTVVPTRQLEGFGLIALESLAAGKPPIVTDNGGLPDAVRGLDESLIVRTDDREALADRIRRGLAGEIPDASACRAHAAEFSWPAVAQRHLALYRRLGA